MSPFESLRVVVFREGLLWLAQVLETDVCVQGEDLTDTLRRLSLALRFEFQDHDIDAAPPAPPYFHVLWPARCGLLTPREPVLDELGCALTVAIVA